MGQLLAPFADLVADNAIDRLRSLLPGCKWNDDPLEKEAYVG